MSGSSLRRAVVAPTNSYASVVAGQSRLSTSDPHQSVPGSNRYNPAANIFSPKQLQLIPNPQPVPAYLKHTAYAERLSQHAKAQHAKSPSFSSMPTPSSSLTLSGRPSTVHRGLPFDVVESALVEDDLIKPLPSRWSDSDKCIGIELLSDGLEAKFIGPQKASDNEAAAVRADYPMSPQCGLFYFECKILSKGKESLIGIGFCAAKVPMNRLPGWEPDSWGYHGDDGNAFCCHAPGKHYGPHFAAGDTIGCGVNFRTNTAFFTKNGVHLGTAFRDIKTTKLYPAVGMKRLGEHVRVNFGQEEFMFDIESYMKEEKSSIYGDINLYPASNLHPPLDESALIQAFVSSYLAHDGYVDTARAFAGDVQKEARALASSGRHGSVRPLDIKEDQDAINRQKIRTAILQGDVDQALELTKHYYPKVLEENEMTHFRLKCRKLVEMIGRVSEASARSSAYVNTNAKQQHRQQKHQDEHMEDVFCRDMEIDDHSVNAEECDRMEVEDEEDHISHVKEPLDAAVQYAQNLRVEFQADQRPEIRKALEESFSLVAYQDPKNSVLSHLFDEDGRIAVAEELNSAILVSLGKSSVAPLERLVQQTTALIQELSEDGGPGAFVNLHSDFLKACTF
ncbi:concanavalin A-like lectin/glucanase domain-containing protein [Kalaharituber pfeilii]|nr:concanavalin A-like lectin/glucanase domain-containing protein [Kalaharituber pfeilii]